MESSWTGIPSASSSKSQESSSTLIWLSVSRDSIFVFCKSPSNRKPAPKDWYFTMLRLHPILSSHSYPWILVLHHMRTKYLWLWIDWGRILPILHLNVKECSYVDPRGLSVFLAHFSISNISTSPISFPNHPISPAYAKESHHLQNLKSALFQFSICFDQSFLLWIQNWESQVCQHHLQQHFAVCFFHWSFVLPLIIFVLLLVPSPLLLSSRWFHSLDFTWCFNWFTTS